MILRDPVHGLVAFEADEYSIVPRLLDTAEVQRLRRIRQLGLTSFAYPGADHTRFSHAIGTAHVMTRFLRRLQEIHGDLPFWQRVTTERARDAVAAALLHDVGHGPFSHLFEEALPDGPAHETWTSRVVLDPGTEVHAVLAESDPGLPERVNELVHGRHRLTYLARMVSGTFDVDRCDYLLRDAHATGVEYGLFDLDWLLRSLRFGEAPGGDGSPGLAIDGAKGLPAIESFILARHFMFQHVYFHKASRASEWMVGRLLRRVAELVADGARLPALPRALETLARTGDAPLGEYLALDDVALWTAIAAFRDARDPLVAELSQRLYARRLWKTLELYGEDREPAARDHALAVARDLAARRGLDPDQTVGLDVASDTPFEDPGDSLVVLFPSGRAKAPSEVSLLLGRLLGERMERVRLIFHPDLRDDVVRALAR
ncbi:MAG: HD domain-containing protein [Deltaproteobacteria bacterium]|nr:HD domain-containing protein [Deltaproteobacteria bacterium]